MRREAQQMAREGWIIHHLRYDTGMLLASLHGSVSVFSWKDEEWSELTEKNNKPRRAS